MFRRDVDRPDIQAFAYTGFGSLSGAAYLFLRVVDAPSARGFLGGLRIASIEDLEQSEARRGDAMRDDRRRPEGARRRRIRRPAIQSGVRRGHGRQRRTARCDSATSAPMRRTSGHGASAIASRMRSSCCSPARNASATSCARRARRPKRSGFSAIEALPTDGHGRCRAVRLRRRDLAAGVRLGPSAHARDEGRSRVHQSDRPRRDPARLLQRIRLPSGLAKARAGRSERCAPEPGRRRGVGK